jgi:hypothetical protein
MPRRTRGATVLPRLVSTWASTLDRNGRRRRGTRRGRFPQSTVAENLLDDVGLMPLRMPGAMVLGLLEVQ